MINMINMISMIDKSSFAKSLIDHDLLVKSKKKSNLIFVNPKEWYPP